MCRGISIGASVLNHSLCQSGQPQGHCHLIYLAMGKPKKEVPVEPESSKEGRGEEGGPPARKRGRPRKVVQEATKAEESRRGQKQEAGPAAAPRPPPPAPPPPPPPPPPPAAEEEEEEEDDAESNNKKHKESDLGSVDNGAPPPFKPSTVRHRREGSRRKSEPRRAAD